MDLQYDLAQVLALENITLKQLNSSKKYKALRYDLIHTYINDLQYKGFKQEPALTEIRKIGLKIRSIEAREFYREASGYQKKSRYAAKLPLDTLPNEKRIPERKVGKLKTGVYQYGVIIYLNCKKEKDLEHIRKSKRKGRKLPDKSSITNERRYNKTDYISFYGELMTKREVNDYVSALLLGDESIDELINNYSIIGSDASFNDLFKQSCNIVGFKYDRLFQA